MKAESTIQLQQRRILLSLATLLVLLASVLVDGAERPAARQGGDKPHKKFSSQCGTADQVALRVSKCMDEIFDLVEGRFGEPKTDNDMQEHCNRFNRTERCVRQTSKDCLGGIHKAATSAVASATKRFRTQECRTVQSRGRYTEPLKCALKKGNDMKQLYVRHTAMMQAVRDQPIIPEEKLVKMCCLLNNMDKEIAQTFDATCPQHTSVVLGIVQAMTEDARNTLCANPKCKNVVESLRSARYQPAHNFIEPLAQILYQLSVD